MNTVELLDFGAKILKHNKIVSYRLDSEVILSNILNISRENLLVKEHNVSEKKIVKFKSLISRSSEVFMSYPGILSMDCYVHEYDPQLH